MITCPKCSKELADGTRFCVNCGTDVTAPQAAPAAAPEKPFQPAEQVKKEKAPKQPKAPLKLPKKWLAIGGGALALIIVIAIVLGIVLSGGADKVNNYALYIKNGEMYYTDIAKMQTRQITTDLLGNSYMSDDDLAEAGYAFGMYTVLSKDGKVMFFIDKLEEDSEGFSLFYRSMEDLTQEPVKVDSDISNYTINDDCNCITYLKNDALYQHNLLEKVKIDSDISTFRVTSDGKKIVYRTTDDDVYYKNSGAEPEKVASDVEYLYFVDDSLSAILYLKEGSLYKKVEGQDQVKIASDVASVVSVCNNGAVYYQKEGETELALKDFVEDDLAASDAAMAEPVEPTWPTAPNYPYSWNFATMEEYQAAVAQYDIDYAAYQAARDQYYIDYEAYQDAYSDYREKLSRDSLRESLADETVSLSTSVLYYYNGTEEKKVTDTYSGSRTSSSETPIVIFSAYDTTGISKVKMSEVSYLYEISSAVQEKITTKQYIAVKDVVSELEQTGTGYTNYKISSDGNTVYYIADVNDEGSHGDLYKMTIADGKPQKAEVYDTDVYADYIYFIAEGKLAYWKDVDDSQGEFYINKERIDYDVEVYSVKFDEDTNTLIYFADWSDDNEQGTLKMFVDGTAAKLADDVHDFVITPNGEILYLYDYSTSHYRGDLYLFKEGKPIKMDEDVTTLIPIYAR